ncbi:MAG TPA: acyltransferase, partial [Flavisolibacter sp.]|nr:acyltransferase [Flavisolibacter sp.]
MAEDYFVHESSIIDTPCEIGYGVKIWHFCHIMPYAHIGIGCVIGQNVFIASRVWLGKNVHVQNNVSLYEGVHCEDDVFIGPSVVFTNIKIPRSAISRKDQYRKTLVEKGASIGANATILCGTTIGTYSMIGAGSTVTKDVLPYALVQGNPARQVGWVSESGHKLNFVDGKAYCPE